MVRDYSFRNNRRLIGEILAQKRSTHVAQLGTWAVPYYAARTPEGVVEDIGAFQFDVESEDIHALKAHIVRVGRWIKSFNGAMIEVTRLE